jgi:hypothetical protein
MATRKTSIKHLKQVKHLTAMIQTHWCRHNDLQVKWQDLLAKMTEAERQAVADELGWCGLDERTFYDVGC